MGEEETGKGLCCGVQELHVVVRNAGRDDATYARIERGGAEAEPAAHGDAKQSNVVEFEEVQYGARRLLPAVVERQTGLPPGGPLTGPFDGDDLVTPVGEEPHPRVELFDE